MIIENQAMVTDAVVEAFGRAGDPRLREILLALVRHLHGFVREVALTEAEFQQATRIIASLGQKTTASHNEVVLMAGSLGVSALVCLLNNGDNGQSETQANLLGPFWRDDQPMSASGDTLLRSPTPGPELLVHTRVTDRDGRPVAGAEVDVWHSSPDGLYENQDPSQAEMNLRGVLSPIKPAAFISAVSNHRAIRSRSTARSVIWSGQPAVIITGPRICTS
jgi:catechol 1,2-dioxygenase